MAKLDPSLFRLHRALECSICAKNQRTASRLRKIEVFFEVCICEPIVEMLASGSAHARPAFGFVACGATQAPIAAPASRVSSTAIFSWGYQLGVAADDADTTVHTTSMASSSAAPTRPMIPSPSRGHLAQTRHHARERLEAATLPSADLMARLRRTLATCAALPLITGVALFAVARADAADRPLPLTTVARVALPGTPVRFDYTSLDAAAGRLYIAHMDQDELLVFDTRTRRVLATIPAPGVHGVLAVPGSAASSRRRRTTTRRSRSTRAPITWSHTHRQALPGRPRLRLRRAPGLRLRRERRAGDGPERLRPARRDDRARRRGRQRAVRRSSRHVLVDVQTRDDIAVIDPRSNRIIGRVSLPGCDHRHGLLVDSPHRLAFVACDGNATLLTLDLRTMKITGRALVGGSPDVLAYDSSNRRICLSARAHRRRLPRRAERTRTRRSRRRRTVPSTRDHLSTPAPAVQRGTTAAPDHAVFLDRRAHSVAVPRAAEVQLDV